MKYEVIRYRQPEHVLHTRVVPRAMEVQHSAVPSLPSLIRSFFQPPAQVIRETKELIGNEYEIQEIRDTFTIIEED